MEGTINHPLPPLSTASPLTPHRPRVESSTCSTLDLSWSLPLSLPSSLLSPATLSNGEITGYTVRYKDLGGFGWSHVDFEVVDLFDVEGGGRGVLEGLSSNQLYEVQVQTMGQDGRRSSFSESLVALTAQAGNWQPFNFNQNFLDKFSCQL